MDVPLLAEYTRGTTARILAAVVISALLAPAAAAAVDPAEVDLGPGTVASPADERTYVSIQGFHFAGYGQPKKPARLVAADGDAELAWLFEGDEVGAGWFYEIEPFGDGRLAVTSTNPDGTVAFVYDPAADEVVHSTAFPGLRDTHSTSRLAEDRLLVARMRATENGVPEDRLFVTNTTSDTVEWTWRFREHYPNDTDGGFDEDWTHVNDAEFVGEGDRYVLASPRNFDQVIVVDRRTDDIVMRLGADDDHDTLYEQHNPDYLERDDGTPVILVADSENDRVVEYVRDCGDADPRLGAGTPPGECEWNRAWSVRGFNWPRDADRLPNGNTLVTDTLNHRVVEITPEGEVVWEFFAAWAPYEAERGAPGSDGPTMADHGTTGSYAVAGGADDSPAARYTVADAIADLGAGTPLQSTAASVAKRYAHVEPWLRPVWMTSWAFLAFVLGAVLGLGWGGYEAVSRRNAIADAIRTRLGTGE
ncbi:hypothetical protein BRC85_01315 [Halobacteriales archaeon QS_1_69_70]|nr:MAG: hypothetical protein BRC85_01315 [Halobacteriales archaeon QS_1_69_70]